MFSTEQLDQVTRSIKKSFLSGKKDKIENKKIDSKK